MSAVLPRVRRRLRRVRARLSPQSRSAPSAAPPAADPLEPYSSVLPDDQPRTVVVLVDKRLRKQVAPWFSQFAGDRLHVIAAKSAPEWQLKGKDVTYHVGETVGQVHWRLKLLGPVHVIIDLMTDTPAEQAEMCRQILFHLRPGGLYVLDHSVKRQSTFSHDWTVWLGNILDAEDPERAAKTSDRVAELARAVDGVVLNRDLILLTKREEHLVKLRDNEANRMLAAREPSIALDELGVKPAGELAVRARVHSHEAAVPIGGLDLTLKYPPLHLRHYRGTIFYGGNTLMYGDNSVLPDSFRHHLERDPANPRLVNVSPTFARVPDDVQPHRRLEGNFYQIDCAYSGHFGHLMTETVSRLWGWDAAKQAMPDLKALLRSNVPVALNPMFEKRLFHAYGIRDEDIVWTEESVILDSVTSATPMWHNQSPHYVHPEIADTYTRLGDALIDSDAPGQDKIFVSRATRSPRRTCRNATAVERYFEEHGFSVVYPETFDLSQQAGIFAKARVIAGFGGSALFNLMFARNVGTVIVLSHEAYTARNEHLFTSLLDCDVHYFWSPPDIPHPQRGWSQAAFYSDWEFDFARNQAELDTVLSGV